MNRIKNVPMRRQPTILGLAAVLVALLVAPSSAAVQPKAGKWKGRTSQGLPIEFVVKKKGKGYKVVSARYRINLSCTATVVGDFSPTGTGAPLTFQYTGSREESWPVPEPPDVSGTGNRTGYEASGSRWGYRYYTSGKTTVEGTGEVISEGRDYRRARGRFSGEKKAKGFLQQAEYDFRNTTVGSHPIGTPRGQSTSNCASGTVRWKARRR